MNQALVDLYTELNDRLLWVDGDSSFSPNKLSNKILTGASCDNFYVTEINDDVKQYNALAVEPVSVKTEVNPINSSWNIPTYYATLNVRHFICAAFTEKMVAENHSEDFIKSRYSRIKTELNLFEEYNMIDLLRTLIYIVDTFIQHDVVWGTGRGSSCCSYVLYIIGLHDVDSVEYELELSEFFR